MHPPVFYQVYIVTFGIMLILLIRTLIDNEPHLTQYRLFQGIIIASMVAMGLELASWIWDGSPGANGRCLATAANFLLFICNLVPLMLWVLYIEFQIFHNQNRMKRVAGILGFLFLGNALLSILSLRYGWYFFIDDANVYHRGPWFWIAIALYFGLLAYAMILPLVQRKTIPSRLRHPLLLFSLPAIIGVLAQIMVYSLNLIWAGVALSMLVLYTSVQSQSLSTDYLTGLYNRRQLDAYLQHRIRTLHNGRWLAALMIDINQFKSINDRFGHHVGDQAIESTAIILRKVFHHQDFIARYAGDEFVVILELDGTADLNTILSRIDEQFSLFNTRADKPFKLSVSVGSALYDPKTCPDAETLIKQADQAMYSIKHQHGPLA